MRLLHLMIGCDFIMYYSVQDLQNVYLKYRYCEVLYALPQRTKICYFTDKLNSKIKYCRAAGCYATIVKQLSNTTIICSAVVLPSKKPKILNSDIVVLVGRIVGAHKKYFQNTRAGFNRSHGFKQTVRGVVKNPVDHPHGGRTRTILWPRTP
jgi:large subunit ribosomal protein L2